MLAALPSYVWEHDGRLEQEPLADYGIVGMPKEVAGLVAPNAPL